MTFQLPDHRLLAMLREDTPYGDLTTLGLGIAVTCAAGRYRRRGVFRSVTTRPTSRQP